MDEEFCDMEFEITDQESFDKLINLLKEDGGIATISLYDVVKYGRVVNFEEMQGNMMSYHFGYDGLINKLLNSEYAQDKYMSVNYEGYKYWCQDVAIALKLLLGTDECINKDFLPEKKYNATDIEMRYKIGAENLVYDNRFGSVIWDIFFKRYKRRFYRLGTIDSDRFSVADISEQELSDIKEELVRNGDMVYNINYWNSARVKDCLNRYCIPCIIVKKFI